MCGCDGYYWQTKDDKECHAFTFAALKKENITLDSEFIKKQLKTSSQMVDCVVKHVRTEVIN